MQIGLYELQVLVSDRTVREYGSQGRTFVEGKKGSYFTLRFRNNSSCRVLAVPSVDGLSTIDGQPATPGSRGYIVAAYTAIEIKGWRQDLDKVASFVFTDRQGSYASQTAGAANCGLIAVKVFAEKLPPPPQVKEIHHYHHTHHYHDWPYIWPRPYYPYEPVYWSSVAGCHSSGSPISLLNAGTVEGGATSTVQNSILFTANADSHAQYACNVNSLADSQAKCANMVQLTQASAEQTAADFNLGTGWGGDRDDRVSESSFERGMELATLEIFYSDDQGLAAAGIQLNKAPLVSKPLPQGFSGFCRPPGVAISGS